MLEEAFSAGSSCSFGVGDGIYSFFVITYTARSATSSLSSSKSKQVKRNLYFSEKGQEITAHSGNILNLPYLDSEEEEEEGLDLALQVVEEIEELPSPTPK